MLADGNGSESGGCNLLDQVQAEKSWDTHRSCTPTTAIRECADGVCAEDANGCWLVLVAASRRVVERVAERNCGSTIGRGRKRSTMWTIERPPRQ